MNDPLDHRLDKDLAAGLIEVPDDFEQRVMARIDIQPLPQGLAEPQPGERRVHRKRHWLEWLALVGGTLVGLVQVLAFIFGVWSTSSLS